MPSLHTQMARLIHHLSSSYLAVSIITLFSGLHCFVRLTARSDMFQIKSLLWGNFVVVQLKELRCLEEHSLPQKRPSVYFSEWILKVDLCRAQCRGPNGAQSMNHRYQELCIPNGKNTTSWVSTSGPTPLWSWLLFGCRVDPVENATHAPWRGTLETSVGRGAQTGADGIVQTAAVCPSAQPLILTSLNQQSSLSNQVPVIRSCFLLLCWKLNCFSRTKNFKFSMSYKVLYLPPVRYCSPSHHKYVLPLRIVAQIFSYSGTMRSRRNVCSNKKSQSDIQPSSYKSWRPQATGLLVYNILSDMHNFILSIPHVQQIPLSIFTGVLWCIYKTILIRSLLFQCASVL